MAQQHKQRLTVTAALPYANGPLHIGHLAGAYLPADIFCKYQKTQGKDVLFVCGSDEHGAAILLKALKENTSPQTIIDQFHSINKAAFEGFGIDFDIYHRTSEKIHHETAQEFFLNLHEKGVFTEKKTEQYFDEEYKQFLADRYIQGTCPKCSYEKAYGDQCEKCGSTLSPDELINPISTLSSKSPIKKATSHWYLPMQKYEEWLKTWILEEHSDWKKNVFGQCKSWLEQGLQERAMTRDLEWGVKVPLEGADGKVLYVWLDAPIGYISATKEWAKQNNRNWEDYWKSEETDIIHFIGKDNIVFHCIIFPIILKAHGEYQLPKNVPANEFMNMEGDKISTSRNWAVWLHEYLAEFEGQEDVLRYVLCANMPETKDSEFRWKDFQEKCNSELVAVFGNFVNRAVVLIQKYYDGIVPNINEELSLPLEYSWKQVRSKIDHAEQQMGEAIQNYRFRDAQQAMMEIARIGNKFLADCEPWKLQKTEPELTKTILAIAIQIVARLAKASFPILPFTSEKLLRMLNAEIGADILFGHQLNTPELLFQKVEDKLVEDQLQKLEEIKMQQQAEVELKSEITFEDFTKLDLRTGTILEASSVPKANKLLQFKVDLGFEQRIIVSGVAAHFKPEELIGQSVVVVANLAPKNIRGVESHGMILLAEDDEKGLHFVSGPQNLNGLEVN